MKKMAMEYLAVGCLGFLGAVSRFFVARLFAFSTFPAGTLVVNVTGSLFLGWFVTVAGDRLGISEAVRMSIAVGFVGAYTTFSTYMYESNRMLEDGAWIGALLYILGSIVLGLIAVRLGIMLGHRMNS